MPDFRKEIAFCLSDLKLAPEREVEIIEELAQHLNDRYEGLVAGGASAGTATEAVLADLRDNMLRAELDAILQKEEAGEKEGEGGLFRGIWKDFIYGARLLRLNPGFAIVAILSLTLGIGANVAIFQLLDSLRLRALPVKDPQQLAQVKIGQAARTGMFTGRNPDLTNAIWEQVRRQQQAFSGMGAWSLQTYDLNRGGEARDVRAMFVSGGFFAMLGVNAARGRLIEQADDRKGCSPAAVLSNSFWQSRFGGADSALGSKITLDGHPFDVIGVTPSGFFGPEVGRSFDVAIPICAESILTTEYSKLDNGLAWWLAAFGRLKPGWTVDSASAHLASISRGIFETTLPSDYTAVDKKAYLEFKLTALPAATGVSTLRRNYESPLWLLMGITGLVLLIACANLANLMVARSASRQREMAVRLALGASRSRLVRQVLAECLLLAVLGAVCGVVMAQALSRLLVSFLSTQQSIVFLTLNPDWRLLAFTIAVTVAATLIFGLTPAIQAARVPPGEALKGSARGLTASAGHFNLRKLVVVSQVALSLVLLVGAILFVQTFRNLITLDAGFQQDHLLAVDVNFTLLNVPPGNRLAFKNELLARLRPIPGVQSAADAFILPLSGSLWNDYINIPEAGLRRKLADYNQTSPGYFQTVGTPLLSGRDFNEHDTTNSPLVAIVTESYARMFLHGANPVGTSFGRVMQGDKPDQVYQIIGLVKDAKYQSLREEFAPIIFVAEAQNENQDPGVEVLIRSDEDLFSLISSIKHVVAQVSPSIVLKFQPFREMVKDGLIRERLMATLSGYFGLLAAILAMIGLYGVISFMVEKRRNEIGIRIALGADRRSILSMILREVASLLVAGASIGLLLALILGDAAGALLFGLRPNDPFILGIAAAGLGVVAVAAAIIPARRGATLDPMQALREE